MTVVLAVNRQVVLTIHAAYVVVIIILDQHIYWWSLGSLPQPRGLLDLPDPPSFKAADALDILAKSPLSATFRRPCNITSIALAFYVGLQRIPLVHSETVGQLSQKDVT